MLSARRFAAALAVAALVMGVAAPRAGADEGDKKESKSIWGRVTGAGKAVVGGAVDVGRSAVDKVWPGDTVGEKVVSVVTGKSLLTPFPDWAEVAKAPVQVQHQVTEWVGKSAIPGYKEAAELGEDIDGAVKDRVPGGWRSVGVAGLVLVLLILWRLLVPPAVSAGKAAVVAKVPVKLGGSRPAPASRPQARHPAGAPSRTTWSHTGRAGKTDVVSTAGGRLVVCADGEDQAMAAARRRWQGWRVRATGTDRCDLGPDKVHVHVTKARRP